MATDLLVDRPQLYRAAVGGIACGGLVPIRQTAIAVLMRAINIEPRQTGSPSRHTASAWLKMRIHLDAFRIAPLAYLVAVWWRICGKRVRARARFAPLLSASPRAYGLWLEREVAVARTPHVAGTIVALIDTAAGQEGVDRTLQSLSCENIVGLVIGGPDGLTLAEAARHIPWQDDPWVLAIAPGDRLAPGTRDAYLNALAHDSARHATIAYADDDLMDLSGRRSAPHFKPDWNAELFRHHDYLTGACILHVSESQLSHTSGSGWAAQLVAQTVAAAKAEPVHVRHVLHHRRTRPRPRLPDALAISGALPPVSVIVPTRNGLNLLRKCLEGVARTDYPDIEVIVVDNGSDDPDTLAYLDALDPCRHRVLRAPGPFNFSTLNNRAAQLARGALLCLLNNDIEVLAPDWLGIMATQALREDVGAVGAQLLYPDGRIQHAGVILGICGGATHAHRLLRPDAQGYFNRHALPQFTSAVTAACLVVQRQRFMAVGGLDEANFAVAFNDVDLCMRLNARGWQSFYEPRAVLIHHESVSRGFDRDPVGAERLAGELEAMKTRWGTDAIVDPFHHPDLNRFSDRFVVQL